MPQRDYLSPEEHETMAQRYVDTLISDAQALIDAPNHAATVAVVSSAAISAVIGFHVAALGKDATRELLRDALNALENAL